MTAAWSQGPQPRPLLSQTPAACSPAFPRVPQPSPSQSLLLPPHLALSGLKLQGTSLSSTAATPGKSTRPPTTRFFSILSSSPQGIHPFKLLTFSIFLWQQVVGEVSSQPNLAKCKKRKKEKKEKSHKIYVTLKEASSELTGGPRSVPY